MRLNVSVRISICSLILTTTIINCKPQTNEDKINLVSQEVVKSIKSGDNQKFRSLIGVELSNIGKNDEMIKKDIQQYKELFERYLNQKQPQILITDLYNNIGQRKVKIPIYDYPSDSVNIKRLFLPGTKTLYLNIYFGPPNIIPLDKISGYELIKNNSDSADFMQMNYWKRSK